MRCWPAKAQASEPRSPERIPLQPLQRPGQGGQIGRTDRALGQSSKRKDGQGTNGCSGMSRAEVTPLKLSSGARWQGPESQGEGRAGGRGKKVPRARDWGRRRRGRQRPTVRRVQLAALRPNPRYRGPSRPRRKG